MNGAIIPDVATQHRSQDARVAVAATSMYLMAREVVPVRPRPARYSASLEVTFRAFSDSDIPRQHSKSGELWCESF